MADNMGGDEDVEGFSDDIQHSVSLDRIMKLWKQRSTVPGGISRIRVVNNLGVKNQSVMIGLANATIQR